jgi:hypothetical protein
VRLDSVTVALRPRNHWEAIDLGMAMARMHWKRLMAAWLMCFVPVVVAASLIFLSHPWAAPLFVWWLKPLFERVPLFMLSRATFGVMPGMRETLKSLLPVWRRNLLRDLTIGRFSLSRSFDMPVRDLEGLRGKACRQRLKGLHKRTRGSAAWLTLACVNFEWVVNLSLIGLVYLFIPQGANSNFLELAFSSDQPVWMVALQNTTYYLAITLIEPFYVAGGFALYLNRRTLLEGWDIEIVFRRLAQRMQPQPGSAVAQPVAGLLAAIVLATCLAGSPQQALAGDAPVSASTAPAEAAAATDEAAEAQDFGNVQPAVARFSVKAQRERIAKVMAHKDLQRKRKETRWQYTGKQPQDKKPVEWDWLEKLSEWLAAVARVAEVVLWTLLALAVAWLIHKRKYWLKRLRITSSMPPDRDAKVLFGLDIGPESLPVDVAGAAWNLWQSGQPRAAMSLLYRGALSHFVTREKLELGVHATEEDCLRLCRKRVAPEVGDYFNRLTRAWQQLAYAARSPAQETVRDLCTDWAKHFRSAA